MTKKQSVYIHLVHRHSVPVETVKEMVMNPEDKITEEKESETTDKTVSALIIFFFCFRK